MALLLITSVFAAQGDGLMSNNAGDDTQNTEQVQTQAGLETQTCAGYCGEVVQAQNTEQVRTMQQEQEQLMNQEMANMGSAEQKVYQNQNQVRLAVHALLSMENMTGGIGSQISTIAKQFNNSIQNTVRAEEKIQARNAFSRFLFGGDADAATELETEVVQNQNRIQEMNQLMEQCECDEEVKAMLQEQIQTMEQEQTRLQELAQSEKQNKGIFGWLFK